jgi:hypothetical protein
MHKTAKKRSPKRRSIKLSSMALFVAFYAGLFASVLWEPTDIPFWAGPITLMFILLVLKLALTLTSQSRRK